MSLFLRPVWHEDWQVKVAKRQWKLCEPERNVCMASWLFKFIYSADRPREISAKLTAVLFIRSIPTVIICVADPVPWDTQVIITSKERRRAGSGRVGGAVLLITAIHTIIVLVTAPVGRDALSSVATGECWWCTGIVYNRNEGVMKTCKWVLTL